MEPREPSQYPDDFEIPFDVDVPPDEHDPDFETGLDILEEKELSGVREWIPVVITGGREKNLLAFSRSFVCLDGDAARHGLVLVASNDDDVCTLQNIPHRATRALKRPHRRGMRGPMMNRR